MGHLRPAFVAQVSEWPLWLALAADVLEVDLNSELICEVGVFTHGVRVHHCFGQYQYTIEYYRSKLLFMNERRVKGEAAYEFVLEVASILYPEIDVAAEPHLHIDVNGHFLYICSLLLFWG